MENHFELFETKVTVLDKIDNSFTECLKRVIGGGKKVFILTDKNIASLWLERIENIINGISKETFTFVVESGESSKNKENLFNIIDSLAVNKFTRKDVFVALGGGVVTDIGALAAGLYMRGMDLVMMPTSLLAMVDAAVGEKTAIDTEYGKNLVGMFYRPTAIIVSTEFLNTLPVDSKNEGMAEVIKTGILAGGELYNMLTSGEYGYFEIVSLCIEYKISIVKIDEFDNNERHVLNLGHTIAHAIELISNYEISHGKAVSVGIYETCKIAFENYMCTKACVDFAETLLKKENLPLRIKEVLPNVTSKELAAAVLSDKKGSTLGNISLAVPVDIGRCLVKDFPSFYAGPVFEKALNS